MGYPVFINGDVLTASDMNAVGMWKITPTSVTNGTLSNGVVTIGNAVPSVTVSGVFSSTYDNYQIIYQIGDASAAAILYIKFNNSSGSTYSYGGGYQQYGLNSWVAEQENNTSNGIRIGNTNPTWSSCVTDIISPYLTTPTHVVSQHADDQFYSTRGGRDSNAASQTGFMLYPNAGTMTGGTIRIYGYRN